MRRFSLVFSSILVAVCCLAQQQKPISFSGIYPSLAMYNNEGECGTGAVVPWADRLWVITYGPHMAYGSSDKLYEITADLHQNVRLESIGGTPANRIIHKESNQLFIGPYVIGSKGNVRTIPWQVMQGRLTGSARHMIDPSGKIYTATMEEGIYEVDVKTLAVKTLFKDGNDRKKGVDESFGADKANLPGAHGKGLYSGQGVLVFSNNGENSKYSRTKFDVESGVLAEWNGKEWKVVRRNQFTEITGPGGVYGNAHPDSDPIWATGWDFKSVLLGVRDAKAGWSFYRLPKASHSYDGAHGWNTEWPRIRDIGTEKKPDYLMTMHGMFWRFPQSFKVSNTAGIRPRSAYLKVVGDFARWNDQLVLGCDDAAQKEFLNKRKVKGDIDGSGQSNSNLWFMSLDKPDQFGPNTAEGAVWISENIKAGVSSEPFLFSGWDNRSAWLKNEGNGDVKFSFYVDKRGNNVWSKLKSVTIKPGSAVSLLFSAKEVGEWVRVTTDKDTKATVHFSYTQNDNRSVNSDVMFTGLSSVQSAESTGGLLWGLENNRRKLGVLAGTLSNNAFVKSGYYELDSLMNLVKKDDVVTSYFIEHKMAIPKQVVTVDEASILIVDERGRRWRLPKGNEKFKDLTNKGLLRVCREVSTERDLFNCSGTFYELPAENADGFAKIRPVSSHNFRIHDYAGYRGLLIMTGIDPKEVANNSHIISSADKKASVWAGAIDDLWKLGKPTGEGGPWKNTLVKSGAVSDPYLIGFYDKRNLTISHDSKEEVVFTIETEPIGHGPWMVYKKITVKPNEQYSFEFPTGFQARWIRFVANKECAATTMLKYN